MSEKYQSLRILDTKVETYKDYTKTQKDFLKSKSGYYHISKPSKL